MSSFTSVPTASAVAVKPAYLVGIAFITALGGWLLGVYFAAISEVLPFLRQQFTLTSWWQGFLTGSLALGCLVAGQLAGSYGQRPGLLAAGTFVVSSWGMAVAPRLGPLWGRASWSALG